MTDPTATPTVAPTATPTPTLTFAPTETPSSSPDDYAYEYKIKNHSEEQGVVKIEVECYKRSNASMIFAEYCNMGRGNKNGCY